LAPDFDFGNFKAWMCMQSQFEHVEPIWGRGQRAIGFMRLECTRDEMDSIQLKLQQYINCHLLVAAMDRVEGSAK
jgi:hypothetical protein